MTAMRLAENVAHTIDVDAMLNEMTPQQFDEWHAKDLIEPIGSRSVTYVLSIIGEIIATYLGCDMKAADFTPWVEQRDQDNTVKQSSVLITAALQQAAATGE